MLHDIAKPNQDGDCPVRVVDREVEREVRDALGGLVCSGTSDIQRNLTARLMGVAGG